MARNLFHVGGLVAALTAFSGCCSSHSYWERYKTERRTTLDTNIGHLTLKLEFADRGSHRALEDVVRLSPLPKCGVEALSSIAAVLQDRGYTFDSHDGSLAEGLRSKKLSRGAGALLYVSVAQKQGLPIHLVLGQADASGRYDTFVRYDPSGCHNPLGRDTGSVLWDPIHGVIAEKNYIAKKKISENALVAGTLRSLTSEQAVAYMYADSGRREYERGNDLAALVHCTNALDFDPLSVHAHTFRALILVRRKGPDDLTIAAREFSAIYSHLEDAAHHYDVRACPHQRFEDCGSNKRMSLLHTIRGLYTSNIDNLSDASRHFRKAAEFDPHYVGVRLLFPLFEEHRKSRPPVQ